MKIFIIRILTFLIPILFLILVVVYLDFFKIRGFRNDYYEENKVQLNREMICTKTFNFYRKKKNFDSFIFGSSRSNAFKCENWVNYLDADAEPFHFDASGEGIWGISKKIQYIDEKGDSIRNALIILDRRTLRTTKIPRGHLFVPMPSVSKASSIKYYGTFIKASLNIKFITAYIDYSIFHTYRDYMGFLISPSKFKNIVNKENCDIWYGYDKQITLDSIGYYKSMLSKNVFYPRPVAKINKCEVTKLEIKLLNSIKKTFARHKTKYKIVISPVYDQIPLEDDQNLLLNDIFGVNNVYDFSGVNDYTEPISNYYESSHYRPHVADKIMEEIYD